MHLTLFSALLILSTLLISCKTDDSPGFFLKITKNVPRLGRRSDKEYESYFLKNAKHVPRIGRRDENTIPLGDLMSWLNEIPQPDKRVLMHPAVAAAAAEHEYSMVQPVNTNTLMELIERDAIKSENVKFVHWKDFDRALQMDVDLYSKVISLGRMPDQRLKEDLGFSKYMPSYGNFNDDTDFVFYNRAENEMYPSKYDREMLQYNNLKK